MDTVPLVLAVALIGVCSVVGAWDVYAAFSPSQPQTVSQVVYGWSREFPPLVLAIGIILGHVLWPVQPRDWRGE
jgi:hypothetical protein